MAADRSSRVHRFVSKHGRITDCLHSVEFDQDERIFDGSLEFIRALVFHEAKDAEGLIRHSVKPSTTILRTPRRKARRRHGRSRAALHSHGERIGIAARRSRPRAPA
jgi:hypothetical protein